MSYVKSLAELERGSLPLAGVLQIETTDKCERASQGWICAGRGLLGA